MFLLIFGYFINFCEMFYFNFWNLTGWMSIQWRNFLKRAFQLKIIPIFADFCLFLWFSQNAFPGVCIHLVRNILGLRVATDLKFSGKFPYMIVYWMNGLKSFKIGFLIFNLKKAFFSVSYPLEKIFNFFFTHSRPFLNISHLKKKLTS